MEISKKNQRRSVSLGDISKYTTEEIKNMLEEDYDGKNKNLLMFYLDKIRNYNNLSEEMIENISKMDEESKIKIIREINMLHRPERKMRQNVVMICIFYNYVSNNLTNAPL